MKKTFLNTLTPEEVIKRLRKGEVIKCEDSDKVFYMIDGILVNEDSKKSILVCPCFEISEQVDYLYFEEEEPFIITETGVYRTREGRKAFVYKIDDGDFDDKYPVNYILENDGTSHSATKRGKYNAKQETELDIVAKWED